MRFGFSYVGFIYLIMLMIPNLIWAKNKPVDYDRYARNENRILLFLERTGEVLVSVVVLVFRDFDLRAWTPWCLWLAASFLLMIEKKFPLEWIEGTNRIADEFFRYADPLIGSIPEYAILR